MWILQKKLTYGSQSVQSLIEYHVKKRKMQKDLQTIQCHHSNMSSCMFCLVSIELFGFPVPPRRCLSGSENSFQEHKVLYRSSLLILPSKCIRLMHLTFKMYKFSWGRPWPLRVYHKDGSPQGACSNAEPPLEGPGRS